jgi:hypothetical protein
MGTGMASRHESTGRGPQPRDLFIPAEQRPRGIKELVPVGAQQSAGVRALIALIV